MRICVDYYEHVIHSEQESGSYGSWSKSYDSGISDVYEISKDAELSYHSETFKVPDDTTIVWVVYMRYSTGDSFGHADGKIDIIHCTSNEEAAHKLANQIQKNPNEYTIKFVNDFGREISIYNNGAGYFERIEYIEVERYEVGSSARRKRYEVN